MANKCRQMIRKTEKDNEEVNENHDDKQKANEQSENSLDSLMIEPIDAKPINVKLLCNWCTSDQLRELWNKMTKGHYMWNRIVVVDSSVEPKDIDYYAVINSTVEKFNPKKTFLFRMEPYMERNPGKWGEWSNPVHIPFIKVFRHETEYNNNEWHLSKTYDQLSKEIIVKDDKLNNCISTVLSDKYYDIGHIRRIDFVKYLESKGMTVHVFGSNKWNYLNYKGSLPSHSKENGLFPYKYTFNVENHSIKNYYTEKLIDGILSECLVFYNGCYNAREYIDERAFVYLELKNFEADLNLIKKAISEDWHSQRLPYIQAAKKKILNELQFFPRLEREITLLRKE